MVDTTILDLPLEILVDIFTYLHPDLPKLLELSLVCHTFRHAALCCAIPVKLPLSDNQLQLMNTYRIPVLELCNFQPALYVEYQLGHLNLSRLVEAQLVANDYLGRSTNTILRYNSSEYQMVPIFTNLLSSILYFSPHYWCLIQKLNHCSNTLKTLMINVDISKDQQSCSKQYKCAQFCSQFKNLTFLSLHFTPQLELNEKVRHCDKSQNSLQKYFINYILEHCTKLQKFYLYSCPIQQLKIHSTSLEKLCIYKSEFVELCDVQTPNLKILMFHEGLRYFFQKVEEARRHESGHNSQLFEVIYKGCPKIMWFNNVPILIQPHEMNQEEWCQNLLHACLKKCRKGHLLFDL